MKPADAQPLHPIQGLSKADSGPICSPWVDMVQVPSMVPKVGMNPWHVTMLFAGP